ncbi:MAG: hypothetical protein CMM00_06030 [Rhodopirellula sp.]|uniref:hypothetical protein n=1 Tax=Rhodopirellula TaxID=265488 RepID=UPI000C408E66|nr:hypothetical protein [Rhodopirellula sp. UBA1907]MAP08387.1 hypothetical protein [Rhodopirellula sp.]MCR9209506.1 hypothetical protein [bacterium]
MKVTRADRVIGDVIHQEKCSQSMIKFCPHLACCVLLGTIGCEMPADDVAASTQHELSLSQSSVGTMEETIVGTWKDVEADNVDAYFADQTISTVIDEVMEIPLSDLGFADGSLSIHVKAKAKGQWSLDADKLTLEYSSVSDVTVGKATLDSDSLLRKFGPEFVSEFVNDFHKEFEAELPSSLCDQPIHRTVLSINGKVLVTLDESNGEIEQQIRVKEDM